VNYGRPFEPATRPVFIPLPPGAVQPQGWLRDWCLTARAGYTGHMDELDVAFRQAWASDFTLTGEKLRFWDKGSWPLEGGGYWFDGLVKLAYALHDDSLLQQAKARLDVVVNHMNANSILFIWWLNRNKPADMSQDEAGYSELDAFWSRASLILPAPRAARIPSSCRRPSTLSPGAGLPRWRRRSAARYRLLPSAPIKHSQHPRPPLDSAVGPSARSVTFRIVED